MWIGEGVLVALSSFCLWCIFVLLSGSSRNIPITYFELGEFLYILARALIPTAGVSAPSICTIICEGPPASSTPRLCHFRAFIDLLATAQDKLKMELVYVPAHHVPVVSHPFPWRAHMNKLAASLLFSYSGTRTHIRDVYVPYITQLPRQPQLTAPSSISTYTRSVSIHTSLVISARYLTYVSILSTLTTINWITSLAI